MEEKKKKKKRVDVSKFINTEPKVTESNHITSGNSSLPEIGLEIREEDTLDERAPLTLQQRRQRGRTMRRYKGKIAMARKRAARRKASPEKLKIRAKKRARDIIKQRFLQGKKYSDLNPSQKVQIDKRLHRIPDTVISRIATRQLPQVRKAEMERLVKVRGGNKKNESIDQMFETFLQERRECPPKRMHMAMTKEGKVKFDRRFKFFRKEPTTELDESFIDEAEALMEQVENFISEQSATERTLEQIHREKESTKLRHERMKDAAKRTDQSQKNESVNPEDREQATDSLVKIYKKDTTGQKNETYYGSDIPNSYGNFTKGARVRFDVHSMDMVDNETHEGTVVGSNVQHLRVRDDDGVLFKVRHADAELIESVFTFTLDEMFEFSFLSENLLDKAVEAVRNHMTKGKSLEDIIWEFSAATGFKVPTKQLYQHYIKIHGDPKKTSSISTMTDVDRRALIRKYS